MSEGKKGMDFITGPRAKVAPRVLEIIEESEHSALVISDRRLIKLAVMSEYMLFTLDDIYEAIRWRWKWPKDDWPPEVQEKWEAIYEQFHELLRDGGISVDDLKE